jgi:hypothetical protein
MRLAAKQAIRSNGKRFGPTVRRFLYRCQDLGTYLTDNDSALIDYGSRYRAGRAISTSRAEGLVDELANARMAKCQRMRWSPRGAHCMAMVHAAVLDGRLQDAMRARVAA